MDSATFTLKLIDAVSGPAKGAVKALGDVRGALGAMGKAQSSTAKGVAGKGGGAKGIGSVGRGFGEIAKAARAAKGESDRFNPAKGFAEIAKAARAAKGEADKFNPAKGFGEIAKAAKAATDQHREQKKAAASSFKGFAEIAKAARAAKSSGFDGTGKKKKKDSALGDFVKGTLIAGGIEKALGFATSLTREIASGAYELVTFGQNARFAFDQLAKHGAKGEKLFEHARALATRFGLDVEDTTHAYEQFLKLQFDPHQTDDLIRMGADLQALGASAEDVKGVFLALGQIKSKGRFQAEEGLQLQERGVSGELVTEEIGKALGGKSAAEVQKLQQKGKITADVALGAIKEAIKRKLQEKDLGEAGAKFADNTLQGITGRFKALGTDTGLKLVDKITAPLTKVAGKGLDRFEGFLSSPKGAETIDMIASGLGKAAGFAGDLFGAFGSGAGDTLSKAWEGIKPLVEVLGGGEGKGVSETLKTIGRYMGDVAAAGIVVVGVASALGFGFEYLLATAWNVGGGIVKGLTDPLFQMIDDSLAWWFKLKGIWDEQGTSLTDKALGIGKQIVLGFVGGITSLLAYPGDAIAGVAKGTLDALKNALGIHSPSTKAKAISENFTGTYADTLHAGVSDARAGGTALGDAAGYGLSTSSPGAFGPTMSSVASPPSFDTAQRPGGRMGSFSPSFTFQITGTADPAETARIAAREARREFEEFFRNIESET